MSVVNPTPSPAADHCEQKLCPWPSLIACRDPRPYELFSFSHVSARYSPRSGNNQGNKKCFKCLCSEAVNSSSCIFPLGVRETPHVPGRPNGHGIKRLHGVALARYWSKCSGHSSPSGHRHSLQIRQGRACFLLEEQDGPNK